MLDRADSADLMDLVRSDIGLARTRSRFPKKGTCLAIYSYSVNAGCPLEETLVESFPWCDEWEAELKRLFAAYVAAKHGVLGLTKTAAIEYADANIRVNAVCPGFIKTRMTEDTMRRRGEAILAQVPFHSMGNPEEIAEMVVWLCSDRASYVSGAAYNVDGGWMAI